MPKFKLLTILIAAVISTNLLAQPTLPSLSYWEISRVLEQNPDFRQALDITADQRSAIDQMRSDPIWSQLFFRIHVKQFENRDSPRQKVETVIHSQRLSYAAANDEVCQGLAKILDAEQMSRLYPAALRVKFCDCFAALKDPEVRHACQISDASLSKSVQVQLENLERNYRTRVSALQDHGMEQIANVLTPQSLQRLVNVAGNRFAPNVNVVDHSGAVPRLKMESVSDLVSSTKWQQELELTERQIEVIARIDELLQAGITILKQQGKYSATESDRLHLRLELDVSATLSPDQMASLHRLRAAKLFANDFRSLFTLEPLASYIQPDPATRHAYWLFAGQQRQRFLDACRNLDHEYFNLILSLLPAESATQMRQLFEGVWELQVEPFRWTSVY